MPLFFHFSLKKICSIAFFAFLAVNSWGQSNVLQLTGKLATANDNGTRTDIYGDLFKHYEYANPDSALYYASKGYKEFSDRKFKPGIAIMLGQLAALDEDRGYMSPAKEKLTRSLALFTEINNKHGIASVENALGVLDAKASNYSAATAYFLRALTTAESNADTPVIVSAYLKLGALNEQTENLDKALEYYGKIIKLTGDSSAERIFTYNNIGIVYAKKRNEAKALDYFQMAVKGSNNPELRRVHITSLTNVGNLYSDQGNNREALKYFNEALSLTNRQHLPEEYARLLLNIGNIDGQTEPGKALIAYKEALAIAEQIGQKYMQSEIMSSEIFLYDSIKDYKNAFYTLKAQKELNDSLAEQEKDQAMANQESKYELEKSNAQLLLMHAAEKKNKKNCHLFLYWPSVL
jgi:tetratricopeptide (TPR) repeat protein